MNAPESRHDLVDHVWHGSRSRAGREQAHAIRALWNALIARLR